MNETTQQAIVQTLREKILAGELAPGQRLVEAQLAQWLGVSRTPLRYALSVLASEALLERSGARGFVVRRFSVRVTSWSHAATYHALRTNIEPPRQ